QCEALGWEKRIEGGATLLFKKNNKNRPECPCRFTYFQTDAEEIAGGMTENVPLINRYFFFFQAEDVIRDSSVTGVQTCALPICRRARAARTGNAASRSSARESRPD